MALEKIFIPFLHKIFEPPFDVQKPVYNSRTNPDPLTIDNFFVKLQIADRLTFEQSDYKDRSKLVSYLNLGRT